MIRWLLERYHVSEDYWNYRKVISELDTIKDDVLLERAMDYLDGLWYHRLSWLERTLINAWCREKNALLQN